MTPESLPPVPSFEAFRMAMLQAKRAGVPIRPPARPVFQDPACLDMLGRLQFFHEDDTYKRFLICESEGPAPFGFAHPL